jgi:hypothetical protein
VNLRHLRYFINIVDAGSFSRAATVIHVAQPALSQQIAELGPNSGSACCCEPLAGCVLPGWRGAQPRGGSDIAADRAAAKRSALQSRRPGRCCQPRKGANKQGPLVPIHSGQPAGTLCQLTVVSGSVFEVSASISTGVSAELVSR